MIYFLRKNAINKVDLCYGNSHNLDFVDRIPSVVFQHVPLSLVFFFCELVVRSRALVWFRFEFGKKLYTDGIVYFH